MLLELDAGNTRVKWRLVEAQSSTALDNGMHGAFRMQENTRFWDEKFCDSLSPLAHSDIRRVLVSNVRGEGFAESVTEHLKAAWGLVPEFAVPARYCAGVTNGYDEPSKLGVDRWLAILAAYNIARSECCVLNCGTTVTFDIVSKAGKHEGGYIMPGLQLMKDSLFSRSPVLVANDSCEPCLSPGSNTSAAIMNGVLSAIVGFAYVMKTRTKPGKSNCVWIVSGGDGELIRTLLDWETRLCPSLVLDGLRLALP